ncbi:MAG: hypothetical protein ACR2PF_00110 [Rhizobiaceae bacterium]
MSIAMVQDTVLARDYRPIRSVTGIWENVPKGPSAANAITVMAKAT